MQITFKLFAGLTPYLPADKRTGNLMPLQLADGTTIGQAIEPFGLPPQQVHLVLVNGVFIPPEKRPDHMLVDGDVLAIWPPIAGG